MSPCSWVQLLLLASLVPRPKWWVWFRLSKTIKFSSYICFRRKKSIQEHHEEQYYGKDVFSLLTFALHDKLKAYIWFAKKITQKCFANPGSSFETSILKHLTV